ncbi:MAG TPA: phosphotransferase [Rubrobacter sp.]|nr:phosphotransferase [Rubrobacter sp.]
MGEVGVDNEFVIRMLREGIPELGSDEWRLLGWEHERTWRHRGRRFVFGRLHYVGEGGAEATSAEVLVKLYRKDPGDRSLRALRLLWEAGFRSPSPWRVPRPYGRVAQQNLLIQERVGGESWQEHLVLEDGSLAAASAAAADWLLRLQAVPPENANHAPYASGPRSPERLARELMAAHPEKEALLGPLANRLVGVLREGAEPVLSHGDYHPDNVRISRGAVTVIDFDNFGRREAAYDVGYAIGQLMIMSYIRSGDFGAGARAAAAFLERYDEGGGAPPERVGAHVSRTFLQSLHYELVTLKNGRTDLIEPWAEQMDRWLRSRGSETLEDLVRHS